MASVVTGAVVATLLGLAANQASGEERWPGALDVLRRYPWESGATLTLVGAVLSLVLQRLAQVDAAGDPPPPPAGAVPDWVVDRGEASEVIAAVCGRRRRTVGITTALEGAGGFGKTTLADMACASPRVRRLFRGRVFVVTVGREVRSRAAIAAKVAEATRFITGDTAVFDDPVLAGAHLGRLLDQRPRTLLVLDDVWEQEQLEPFLVGGQRCVRLVTTRIPGILPPGAARIRVDAMSDEQARAVLTWDLPALPRPVVELLFAATGRWPLLLRLTNRLIAAELATGAGPDAAARGVLRRLRELGPVGADPARFLDLDDPRQRRKAVKATVEAATELLPSGGARRFAELGVFAEDEAVPVELAARLWRATARTSPAQARELCRVLAGFSLLTLTAEDGGHLILHDVIRDYLRREIGAAGLVALNGVLVDAVAAGLPTAQPLPPDDTTGPAVAWWDTEHGYVLDHLVAHLVTADRLDAAEAVAGDLRWTEARLHQRGASAPWNDLVRLPTETARAKALGLSRAAHLLRPTHPGHALTAVLHSRLEGVPAWRAQARARARQARTGCPALVNRWEPPDQSDPALQRVLVHSSAVHALAVAPDGAWLVTGCGDGTARIWDTDTGTCTATLSGHIRPVTAVAVAPDGTWVATASADGTARIWDVETGTCTATLTGHSAPLSAVAAAPDSTWLVTASEDRTARVWAAGTGVCTTVLSGRHVLAIRAVAVSPDGAWIATGGEDVQMWAMPSGRPVQILHTGSNSTADSVASLAFTPDGARLISGLTKNVRTWRRGGASRGFSSYGSHSTRSDGGRVNALAVAPDGTWMTTGDPRRTVRIWQRQEDADVCAVVLTGHTDDVTGTAIAPDGSWLASASLDGTVRVWNAIQTQAADLSSPPGWLTAAFAPGGTHLVTVSRDPDDWWKGSFEFWDTTTRRRAASLASDDLLPYDMSTMAVSPNRRWIVYGGSDSGRIRMPGAANNRARSASVGEPVTAAAIAPDGTWYATASERRNTKLWRASTHTCFATLGDHVGPADALIIAPDGSWLTTGDGRNLKIWVTATASRAATLTGHTAPLSAAAVAPDGTWLLTASEDRTIRVWDAAAHTCTATLTGLPAPVTGLAVAPDGVHFAAISEESVLRIWDRESRDVVAMMRTDSPLVACAWRAGTDDLTAWGPRGAYGFAFRRGGPGVSA
ncbi:NB-ARC domain-containing protein [Streptomyces sp. NPDC002564]|uniref:NB-ARC domain-containing protein n=1 Tax=Streptomyces sp. NPDC002564 TaxID=3364649 RepID=UPI00367FC6D8